MGNLAERTDRSWEAGKPSGKTSTMIPSSWPAPLEIFLLGAVPFLDIQRLQRRLLYDLGETERGGALILCEHPPTITVGRSGSRAHIRPDDDELRSAGIRMHWVNRGGGCVLHVPGQLAAYLLLPLRGLGLDLWTYVLRLHRVVLAVLEEFDLEGAVRPDAPGIFLGPGRVATVGVSVHRWITGHGLTLNVGPYLRAFDLLDEPTPTGSRLVQTSMEARRQRPAPMARVREAVIRHIEAVFGLERHYLYTDHPQLHGKVRAHAHVPSLR
jgi:lipoyl(octanoyl) transferase